MNASPQEPRWLDADDTAAYIGVRVDKLSRLVKAGKLPTPSRHLGPKQPRWDRLALDRLFAGEDGHEQPSEESMADAIQRAGRDMRAEATRRR